MLDWAFFKLSGLMLGLFFCVPGLMLDWAFFKLSGLMLGLFFCVPGPNARAYSSVCLA